MSLKPLALLAVLLSTPALADAVVWDAYTEHSSACSASSTGGACTSWKQPHRLSFQHTLNEDWTLDLGAGVNSYHKTSVSAGFLYQPLALGDMRAGVFVAAASGYTRQQLRTGFLLGGAAVSWRIGGMVMEVLRVPAVGHNTVSVTQVRVGWGW